MDALSGPATSILTPGETCWRLERAERLAYIVDAADYFRAAKAAMLQARSRIMLIGWDFDTRIELEPNEATLEGPNRLGDFLSWLIDRQPGLDIYLLKWDIGVFTGIGRGMPPIFLLNWITDKRLHLRADSAHPVGSAHHQKIVVIDDAFAFCGGIDMTVERWDSREHREVDERRTDPGGAQHGPWHDATVAVDGAVAGALGEFARDRWFTASGEELAPIDAGDAHVWPDFLEPTLRGVDVGIARTRPEFAAHEEVREIEALYLAAILSARDTLYIESQYLAARTLADAIAQRLQDPECPEIVLVLPRHAEGWLEQKAMDGARHRLLHLLWEADKHGRFRAYYPVTAAGSPIYVHAKVLVMDDRLFRIGSSNLNNRSMGFDTECDLAVEGVPGVTAIRDDLLCEHLGVTESELAEAIHAAESSVIGAIEVLREQPGRTLVPFEPDDVEGEDNVLAENELMDPESPPALLPEWIRTAQAAALKSTSIFSTGR